MVSPKLMSSLKELDRSELARSQTDLIQPGKSDPVWSPKDALEAADTMLKVLKKTKNQERT